MNRNHIGTSSAWLVNGARSVEVAQRFSVNVSGDPSRARSFQWQFASPSGTPSTVAPKGATARIHFPSPGRYVLWVTITDAAGNQTTAVRTVKVVGAPVG